MSYKTILVRSEADWGSDRAIEVALSVAGLFDGAVLGVGAEAMDVVSYGYVQGDLIAAVREQIKTDLASSKSRFDALTQASAVRCDWISSSEYPLDVMNRHARAADLIVARRPDAHVGAASSCKLADLVMETGLPVLVAADSGAALQARQVVVAWSESREARRAVSDAMPFLMQADSVHLVSMLSPGHHHDATAGLKEVQQRLARHGAAVDIQIIAPSPLGVAADLEAAADRLGADLIVSGAFGHSRLREWTLGGVTEALIAGCGKFVLLSR